MASRWFWSLGHGEPDDTGRESNGKNQTARISLTAHFFWSPESSMSTKQRVNGPKRRGQTVKAQSDAGLAEVARATSRLWRKHHLSYDQTKYVVERARRALGVEPPRTRRRTVQRLDYPEVERLIRSACCDSSAGSVATLQSPRSRLAGCSSWRLRFAVYSNGVNSSRRSSSWQ